MQTFNFSLCDSKLKPLATVLRFEVTVVKIALYEVFYIFLNIQFIVGGQKKKQR